VVPAEPKFTTEIECQIRLPIKTLVGKTVAIRCRGKVVRMVPQESGSIGVAATIEHFAFRDLV
jgi:hypothetical protein